MSHHHNERPSHSSPPHEAVFLSQIIREQRHIRVTFTDGDILIEQVRWHTPEFIGMKDGKVINKRSIKYWEVVN